MYHRLDDGLEGMILVGSADVYLTYHMVLLIGGPSIPNVKCNVMVIQYLERCYNGTLVKMHGT